MFYLPRRYDAELVLLHVIIYEEHMMPPVGAAVSYHGVGNIQLPKRSRTEVTQPGHCESQDHC